MKKLIIVLVLLLFTTSVFAVEVVQLAPKPIQKILYDDDISGNSKEYFGWAAINTATSAASWKIMRITYVGNDFTIEYADGNSLQDNIWDNRATTVTYK